MVQDTLIAEPYCWKQTGVWGDRSCPELVHEIHCHNCPAFAMAGRRLLDRQPDPAYIEEWQRRLAEPPAKALAGQISLVVFSMNGQWFALEVSVFRENGYSLPVRRVPGKSNAVFRGLVNLRGELLLAYSLRSLINPELAADDTTSDDGLRFMLCEHESRRYLFDVDVTLGVVRVPEGELSMPPANVGLAMDSYTARLVRMDHAEVALLDSSRVFAALERANC